MPHFPREQTQQRCVCIHEGKSCACLSVCGFMNVLAVSKCIILWILWWAYGNMNMHIFPHSNQRTLKLIKGLWMYICSLPVSYFSATTKLDDLPVTLLSYASLILCSHNSVVANIFSVLELWSWFSSKLCFNTCLNFIIF